MIDVPCIPYGMAKRIVKTMRVGDTYNVRPQWVVAFHNAAHRMGLRLATVQLTIRGERMARVMRIDESWPTGHMVSRLPRRDRATGRWSGKAS